MNSHRAGRPNGGYGWVVLMSAFVIMSLTLGVLRNMGIFFLDIQSHFEVTNGTTSGVMSITCLMFNLGAPVATELTLQYSQRVVIIMGGLFAALGLTLSFLDLGLPWLYFTVGIMEGMGVSFSWTGACSMVSGYFDRRLPIAYGILTTGEPFGSLLLSFLFQWLLEMYGWQGTLLIIGGLQLNVCVCGALMRPREMVQKMLQENADGQENNPTVLPQKRKIHFQFSMIKYPPFFLFILFAVFAGAGILIPPTFIVPFARSLGADSYWPALILSVMSFADLVGRLFCGWISNLRLVRTLQLFPMVVTLQGIMLVLLPISRNYWATMVFATFHGFLLGCLVTLQLIAIVDIVSQEEFESGLALLMFVRGVACLSGPLGAGVLADVLEDYSASFYLAGSSLLVAAFILVFVDRLVQKRKGRQADGHQVIDQEDKEKSWETIS
ncbi:monocarboxylate transporter 13 [Antennarius striatus]|uniref:monocarboxylate transporter 13 n=1 Tax=Antennarius striatus TaxID=241820 RepID=UPI0035B1FE7B